MYSFVRTAVEGGVVLVVRETEEGAVDGAGAGELVDAGEDGAEGGHA